MWDGLRLKYHATVQNQFSTLIVELRQKAVYTWAATYEGGVHDLSSSNLDMSTPVW